MDDIIKKFLKTFRKSEILNLVKELRVYCGECRKEISDNDKTGYYCASTHSAYHLGNCMEKAQARELDEYEQMAGKVENYPRSNIVKPTFTQKTLDELVELKLDGWIVDKK